MVLTLEHSDERYRGRVPPRSVSAKSGREAFWLVVGAALAGAATMLALGLAGGHVRVARSGILLGLLAGGAIIGHSAGSTWAVICCVVLLLLSSHSLHVILIDVERAHRPPPTFWDVLLGWWFAEEIGKALDEAVPTFVLVAVLIWTAIAVVGVVVGRWCSRPRVTCTSAGPSGPGAL